MSRGRWGGAALATITTVTGLLLTAAPAQAHRPEPSAAQVAHSKQVVASYERQVAAAAKQVDRAAARAQQLGEAADAASEVYDGAEVKLTAAQAQLHTAQIVLAGANQRVASGERQVQQFATAAYESGGLSTVNAMLDTDGTARLLNRVGDIDAVAATNNDTLQQLDASQIYRAVVQRRAEAITAQASTAAHTAAVARAAAQSAATKQQAVVDSLNAQKQHLHNLLAEAKTHASTLERQRIEAILEQRRIAERRRVAAEQRQAAERAQATAPSSGTSGTTAPSSSSPTPYAGGSGSTAGTVSAGTAAAAVHEAESQIGKPYQWGAAGPNTYDCSGLVMWAYDQVGVHLDHYTGDQWNEGAHVSRDELRPGDLVFFAYNTADPSTIHHVGMYIGGGQMVEAPYTGADVQISSAFRPDYIGAVRPYQR